MLSPSSSLATSLTQVTGGLEETQAKTVFSTIEIVLRDHIGNSHGSGAPPERGETDRPARLAPQPLGRAGPGLATKVSGGIRGLYVHVPFCFHKCHYCDFYSLVDNQGRQGVFTDRLIEEIRATGELLASMAGPIETVFIGGGTPTLLAVEHWRRLLAELARHLPLAEDYEFTVEANPETVTAELVAVLAAGGVNRASIGCQSFDPRHLKTLERWHDPANVERSMQIMRAAGICNVNLDLIFAIPGQTERDWLEDLSRALQLRPDHLSCYSLMYEPNTPLAVKLKLGQVEPVEQEVEAAMFEATIDTLAAAGFEHYEVSNWARGPHPQCSADGVPQHADRRCRHNLLYWTNANWWPLGPSASGHVSGLRWKNVPRLAEYLGHGPLPPIIDVERLDDDGRVGEELMLGLRLVSGIENSRLAALLALGTRGDQRRADIAHHARGGLLERSDSHLRLTRRGLLLADRVLSDLL